MQMINKHYNIMTKKKMAFAYLASTQKNFSMTSTVCNDVRHKSLTLDTTPSHQLEILYGSTNEEKITFSRNWAHSTFRENNFFFDSKHFFLFQTGLLALLLFVGVLIFTAAFTLYESKLMGLFQRREGPDRVGIEGIGQPFADGLKLLLKETIIPRQTSAPSTFFVAPLLSLTSALLTWTILPINSAGAFINSEVSILLFFAISSIGSYGVIYAGWSSNNKYALLGSMRAIAQFISYEVILSLLFMPTLSVVGSTDLLSVIIYQEKYGWLFYNIPIVSIFLVVMLAETNRTPFDLPEAEAELVSGFNVEYSSMLFALFFLAEYSSMGAMAAIFVIFFLGGFSFSPFGHTHFDSKITDMDPKFFMENMFNKSKYPYQYKAFEALDSPSDPCNIHNEVNLTFKGKLPFQNYDIFMSTPPINKMGAAMNLWKYVYFSDCLTETVTSRVINFLASTQELFIKRFFFFETFIFTMKIIMLATFFICVRAALPSKSFDQLIYLCWKYFFPLTLMSVIWSIFFYYFSYQWLIGSFMPRPIPYKSSETIKEYFLTAMNPDTLLLDESMYSSNNFYSDIFKNYKLNTYAPFMSELYEDPTRYDSISKRLAYMIKNCYFHSLMDINDHLNQFGFVNGLDVPSLGTYLDYHKKFSFKPTLFATEKWTAEIDHKNYNKTLEYFVNNCMNHLEQRYNLWEFQKPKTLVDIVDENFFLETGRTINEVTDGKK